MSRDSDMNQMKLPQDTGFEIEALAIWGRARYLWVTQSLDSNPFMVAL